MPETHEEYSEPVAKRLKVDPAITIQEQSFEIIARSFARPSLISLLYNCLSDVLRMGGFDYLCKFVREYNEWATRNSRIRIPEDVFYSDSPFHV